MANGVRLKRNQSKAQSGFTMLEVIFACIILLIVASGTLALFAVGASRNASQGDSATRTTEYAQDKMEQLMALEFNDTGSDVASSSITCYYYDDACDLAPCPYGLTATGSIPSECSQDYVDMNGNASTSATGAAYMRVWTITDTSSTVKTIQVTVTATFATGGGVPAKTVLISQRALDYQSS